MPPIPTMGLKYKKYVSSENIGTSVLMFTFECTKLSFTIEMCVHLCTFWSVGNTGYVRKRFLQWFQLHFDKQHIHLDP